MTETVGSIAVQVGANVGGFISDMNKAAGAVEGFDKKAVAAMKTVAGFAVAAVSAGTALALGMYKSSAETIDVQAKLARAVGTTTAEIQTLEHASNLAGISKEALASAAGKLNQRLGEAITVGGAAADQLDRMGLSAKELAKMDATDRMATIADRMVQLGYDSTQTSFALKELGIKGNEMVAMMMDGGEQFRAAREQLEDFNVTVSDVDAAKIEAANDAWTTVQLALRGAANTLAVELSPYVQAVAEYLSNAAKEGGGLGAAIKKGVEIGLRALGFMGDVIQGIKVVLKGIQLVGTAAFAALVTAAEIFATNVAKVMDAIVITINSVFMAIAEVKGETADLIALPSESKFMQGLHDKANELRERVSVIKTEMHDMAMQQLPSDKFKEYSEKIKVIAEENAKAIVASRKKIFSAPEQNEEQKTKSDKADGIIKNLKAGTQAMQMELAKRAEITQIYRQNQLSLDASAYAQQINDIRTSEAVKQAELVASYQKEAAVRAEQQAQNMERVIGDREAMIAIKAQYDAQELLADQLYQAEKTKIEEEGKLAREKLRKIEKDNAISMALSLGSQLMNLMQGQSRRAFEFAKKAALGSAVVDGWRSAVSAWQAGMSTGGPWAPVVAAGYTAASLLKTGSMIKSIRSTSFGSGGGGSGAAGGSVAVPGGGGGSAGGGAAPNAGATMFVQGLNPNDLFTGSAVKTIAQGLLSYQKDGGKVVFNA